MASEYYTHTTFPATSSFGSSAQMRAELDSIDAGFAKLPTLSGNAGKFVLVNASANGQAVASTLSESGSMVTASTNLSVGAALSVGGAATLSSTLAVAGVATLTANPVLSSGTASGVVYLNGSKVATSGSALTFDGANFATTGSVTLENARYYQSKTPGGATIRMLGINAGNTAYVGPIDSGPAESIINASSSVLNTQFYAAGTERMRLDSSGNLGIGTSSPGYRLAVATNASTTVADFVSTASGDAAFIGIKSSGGTYAYLGTISGSMHFQTPGSGYSTKLTIDTSGNVGIGRTASLTQLQVKQSTGYAFGIDNSNETQNYSWRVDTGAGNPLILGTRTTSTDLLWLSAAGNLGLGVSPSAWQTAVRAFDIAGGSNAGALYSGAGVNLGAISNAYYLSGLFYYKTTAAASDYRQESGAHRWYTAPSGTAGNPITFTQAMTLDSTGLGIGTSSPYSGTRLTLQESASSPGGLAIRNRNSTQTWQLSVDAAAVDDKILAFIDPGAGAVRMALDSSGNLGLGVTPSAWGGSNKAIDIGAIGGVAADTATMRVLSNAYADSGGTFRYKTTAAAFTYVQNLSIGHAWYNAPSGTAGNPITFTQAMTLNANGELALTSTKPSISMQAGVSSVYWITAQSATNTLSIGASGGSAPSVGAINIDANGNVTANIGTLGYGTGSGGAVTQVTGRTTGVTLNKSNGAITLVSAAGTASWQSFTVTNSTVAATDVVRVVQASGTDLYQIHVTAVAAGSFRITFATTGGTTTEQPVFNFAVLKAVTA